MHKFDKFVNANDIKLLVCFCFYKVLRLPMRYFNICKGSFR